ncbi:hypothetical protein LTR12_006005 [Friedmanniomyces endolithicus]|nr:hypothetical protein LTR12_006005 [Friedmanniomyces endolithicus]
MELQLEAHGSDDAAAPLLRLLGNVFVAQFLSINVFRLQNKIDTLDAKAVAKFVNIGNSRDAPQLFLLYCSKCRWKHTISEHELNCTGPSGDRVPCLNEDCGKSFANKKSLARHTAVVHNWVPKACINCPDELDTLFYSSADLQRHDTFAHGNYNVPIICPRKDVCAREEPFKKPQNLWDHLKSVHMMTLKEVEVYVLDKRKAGRSKPHKRKGKKTDHEETDHDSGDNDGDEDDGEVTLAKRSRLD